MNGDIEYLWSNLGSTTDLSVEETITLRKLQYYQDIKKVMI